MLRPVLAFAFLLFICVAASAQRAPIAPPLTDPERRAARLATEATIDAAERLGLSATEYAESRRGIAAGLIAVNEASGEEYFRIPVDAPFDDGAADEALDFDGTAVGFSGVAAFSGAPRLDLSGNGAATIVNNAQLVSGDFFTTFGVKAVVGRAFGPSDDTSTAEPSVMLSY